MAKTWTDKFNDARPHEVKPAPIDIAGMRAGEVMLLPAPRLIDDFIRKIPSGESRDVKTLRKELARQNGAEVTCPISTGYQLRIVAEAAYEAYERGTPLEAITPFWRVMDEKTPTTKKLSFGAAFVMEQRKREGL